MDRLLIGDGIITAMTKQIRLKVFLLLFYFLYLIALLNSSFILLQENAFGVNNIIGAVISIASFAFWIVTRIQLGDAFSVVPKATFIVQEGLYRKLRHPIYYFSWLAILGMVIFFWSSYLLVMLCAISVLQIVRIKKEERLLEQKFGKEYSDYKKSTWF